MARISGAERRQQIVDAAYEVILERGLANAATRDVTRRLGVGSGLLHHYFPSWQDLRAEAVGFFVSLGIAHMEEVMGQLSGGDLVERFVTWFAEDPELRHWSLWLNALEESRRDPVMASVVSRAHERLSAVILGVVERVVAGDWGRCDDPVATAQRVGALMEGLVRMVILDVEGPDRDRARRLLRQQFDLEFGHGPQSSEGSLA